MATSTQEHKSGSELPVVVGVVVAVVVVSLTILVVCVAVIVSVCRGKKENGSLERRSSGSMTKLAGSEENGTKVPAPVQPNTPAVQVGSTEQTVNQAEALSEAKEHNEDPGSEDEKEEKQWPVSDV